jgi:flagellar biosynthesis protein FliR
MPSRGPWPPASFFPPQAIIKEILMKTVQTLALTSIMALALTGAQTIALAMELGVRVAMPIALVLLLVELSVGLLARAIPQINVFILGMPIKMLVGFAVLAAAMPALISGAATIYHFVFGAASGGTVTG